jgi:hypothetical protein
MGRLPDHHQLRRSGSKGIVRRNGEVQGGTTAAWKDQDPSIASSSRAAVEALLDATAL